MPIKVSILRGTRVIVGVACAATEVARTGPSEKKTEICVEVAVLDGATGVGESFNAGVDVIEIGANGESNEGCPRDSGKPAFKKEPT